MTQTTLTFDDATIEKLFGNEAADYEDIERLREYYLKGKVYNRVAADLPLRIVVGHKGIGKSALIRFAMYEDNLQGILSILVKPDDVLSIAKSNVDFLQRIKDWETGLTQVIAMKAIEELGIGTNVAIQTISQTGGKLINLLHDSISGLLSKAGVDLQPAKESIAKRFLENKKFVFMLMI